MQAHPQDISIMSNAKKHKQINKQTSGQSVSQGGQHRTEQQKACLSCMFVYQPLSDMRIHFVMMGMAKKGAEWVGKRDIGTKSHLLCVSQHLLKGTIIF